MKLKPTNQLIPFETLVDLYYTKCDLVKLSPPDQTYTICNSRKLLLHKMHLISINLTNSLNVPTSRVLSYNFCWSQNCTIYHLYPYLLKLHPTLEPTSSPSLISWFFQCNIQISFYYITRDHPRPLNQKWQNMVTNKLVQNDSGGTRILYREGPKSL